jgi:uncharacterized membrane protein YgcG
MRILIFICLFFSFFSLSVSAAGYKLTLNNGSVTGVIKAGYYETAEAASAYVNSTKGVCAYDSTYGFSYKWDKRDTNNSFLYFKKYHGNSTCLGSGGGDFTVRYYIKSASISFCPDGTYPQPDGNCPKENYCDTIQYQIDYDAAKGACELQGNESQTATFSGQCNREDQRLESSCDIVGITPPEPELCPDGSKPNSDGSCGGGDGGGSGGDGGGSGGGSGGDGGDIDLSGLLDAINENKNGITEAIKDSRPAVNDLLDIQTQALSTSLESNSLLGVGLASLDVSNDALSNIASLTSGLNKTSISTNNIISNISSNLNNVDDSINQASNANTKRITDEIKKNNDELKEQAVNQKKMIDNQLLSNDLLTGLDTKTDNSNKSLSGINNNTDVTNQLLSNIDESILKDKDHVKGDELTELLTKLGDKNAQGLNELSYRVQDFQREMTLNDLSHDHLSNLASSSDELVDNNLNEYQKVVEEAIETALIDTPMTEALFNNVKTFAEELVPVSSKCYNLSFGDYFTIDCSKFQKFRDIFGFFIYVYTALTLMDILFTGIVPNPSRKPY